jgi:hypothetical protein
VIVVTVTRSGGVAGISRQWTVTLEDEEWTELRESGSGRLDPAARDRFEYRVADGSRTVVIAESQLEDRLRSRLVRPAEDGGRTQPS